MSKIKGSSRCLKSEIYIIITAMRGLDKNCCKIYCKYGWCGFITLLDFIIDSSLLEFFFKQFCFEAILWIFLKGLEDSRACPNLIIELPYLWRQKSWSSNKYLGEREREREREREIWCSMHFSWSSQTQNFIPRILQLPDIKSCLSIYLSVAFSLLNMFN